MNNNNEICPVCGDEKPHWRLKYLTCSEGCKQKYRLTKQKEYDRNKSRLEVIEK